MPLSGSVRYMGKSGAFAGTESTLGQTRRRRLPLTYPGFGCVFFSGGTGWFILSERDPGQRI